nr:copper amine oxidase N-terminal domain-containing protein [Paenibacillus silvisoli]
MQEKPIVVKGTTMIPFRAIFEALGMSVSWDNKTKQVTGSKQKLVLELGVNNKIGKVNGKLYPLAQAPFLSGTGTLYINLRFISEAAGATVSWDHAHKIAQITSDSLPSGFTSREIVQFDLLRPDWTKEQMEEIGLRKEVNELGGETRYANDIVTYTYFDFNHDATPGVVDIHGDYAGPRGIRVGDTFEQVMSLFPQLQDWRSSKEGLFYGQVDPYKGFPIGLTGSVYTYEDGAKDVSLATESIYPAR